MTHQTILGHCASGQENTVFYNVQVHGGADAHDRHLVSGFRPNTSGNQGYLMRICHLTRPQRSAVRRLTRNCHFEHRAGLDLVHKGRNKR